MLDTTEKVDSQIDHMKTKVREARNVIRWHRDQKGDDRCWLDDYRVWKLIGVKPLPVLSSEVNEQQCLAECEKYFFNRSTEEADPVPANAIVDPERWDDDLRSATLAGLDHEMDRIKKAITEHYNAGRYYKLRRRRSRPRNYLDDRRLYAVLPERLPADMRLPPHDEFLGSTKPGAGCPAFWASHRHCSMTVHDLHIWGPCHKKTT